MVSANAYPPAAAAAAPPNTATAAAHKHRFSSSSRPASISSSSVVTIKRTASLTSTSTDARHPVRPSASQSPPGGDLIALRVGREREPVPHESSRRRKSVAAGAPVESMVLGESDGLKDLNRWSQSTNSSTASGGGNGGARRSRASSGAALQQNQHLIHQHISPQKKRSRTTIDYSPRSSPNRAPPPATSHGRADSRPRHLSPESSPQRRGPHHRPSPSEEALTALPPLYTTPTWTDLPSNDTESPSTIQSQTITTPSTAASSAYMPDYFVAAEAAEDVASPRGMAAKDKKPVMMRNHTAPLSSLTSARAPGPEAGAPREGMRRVRTSERGMEQTGRAPADGASGRNPDHRRRSRTRESREKDKKVMLSKALQKANTAVLLDNAQNFEGALEAYHDACRLLQHVMDRSTAADDKRKLEAIRVTYGNRIAELEQLEMSRPAAATGWGEKTLPERPLSDQSLTLGSRGLGSPVAESIRDSVVVETATAQRVTGVPVPRVEYPQREEESFYVGTGEVSQEEDEATGPEAGGADWEQPRPHPPQQSLQIPTQNVDDRYMPAPLSPRKIPSPALQAEEPAWRDEQSESPPESSPHDDTLATDAAAAAAVADSAGSWLDTIDESSSCRSSVHSLNQDGLRRKRLLRNSTAASDPDFDAAFDAAVEAAYDDGFEVDLGARGTGNDGRGSVAGERGYERAATHSIIMPSSETTKALSPSYDFLPAPLLSSSDASQAPAGLSDEEEERILDEITQDYANTFNFDLAGAGGKSALPRQSDSSGYSRSTWQSSSQASSGDRGTGTTSLTLETVAEDTLGPHAPQWQGGDGGHPPTAPLPTRPPSLVGGNRTGDVRSRRLSGKEVGQLKIETGSQPSFADGRKRASTFHRPAVRGAAEPAQILPFEFGAQLEPSASETMHEQILRDSPSIDLRAAAAEAVEDARPATATIVEQQQRMSLHESPGELLGGTRPGIFRKNKSSISLRDHLNSTTTTTLLPSPGDSAPSLVTPMSSTFIKRPGEDDALTAQRVRLPALDQHAYSAGALPSGGAYLFDTSLSHPSRADGPASPRSPSSFLTPRLEPCPESFLLRPFWFMRALASTLTHPKGGFLTTRLFVPREAWMTRGVKLKNLEEKVANCDLLTAALGRLAGADTFDADAVHEELQSFEDVMERVQAALAKKLGSEVGVQGLGAMFRDAAAVAAAGGAGLPADSDAALAAAAAASGKSGPGKGYLSSWRKLRSKSSGHPQSTAGAGAAAAGGFGARGSAAGDKDPRAPLPARMSTVPMTSFVPVERRGQRRAGDLRKLAFDGPQREYMASLARLFEAAQILGTCVDLPLLLPITSHSRLQYLLAYPY